MAFIYDNNTRFVPVELSRTSHFVSELLSYLSVTYKIGKLPKHDINNKKKFQEARTLFYLSVFLVDFVKFVFVISS